MSSTPSLKSDSNVSVFDLDVVGPQLDREVELVLAGAHVVLPAVPGTGEDAALEVALPERPLEVEAVALDRVEAAVAVGESDLFLAGLDRPDGSLEDVLGARDGDEAILHGGDPSKALSG
jgi:hypothetical protein